MRRVKVVSRDRILDWQRIHRVQGDMRRIPVQRVFLESDSIIQSPLFQEERAVVDKLARLDPVIAIFFDGWYVDRQKCRKRTEIKKVGNRGVEFDLQRFIVNCHDADLVEVFERAQVERFRIFDVVEEVSVL